MSASLLVTGGAGFIGSQLIERLVGERYRVVCLDNFDPYYPEPVKRDNLQNALASDRVSLVEADIRDSDALGRIFSSERFQAVIHLAARAGVRPSLEDPATYLDVNIRGTLNLLVKCKEFAVPRFVFASSSSVYGPTEGAVKEDSTPCRPLSPYGASKVAGEALCSAYAEAFGLTAVALRLFTTYGPRQRPDMAINRFTGFIDRGQEVPVFGDGHSRRDYTFVTDIVEGLLSALRTPLDGFHVFNLGQGNPAALLDVVGLVERQLGTKARLRFFPSGPGEPLLTCADVSKANAILGYRPTVSIAEGIERYVRWFKERQRIACLS